MNTKEIKKMIGQGGRYTYLLQDGRSIRIFDVRTLKGILSVRALGTTGWIKVDPATDIIERR